MCGKETETGLTLMEGCTPIWNVSYKLGGQRYKIISVATVMKFANISGSGTRCVGMTSVLILNMKNSQAWRSWKKNQGINRFTAFLLCTMTSILHVFLLNLSQRPCQKHELNYTAFDIVGKKLVGKFTGHVLPKTKFWLWWRIIINKDSWPLMNCLLWTDQKKKKKRN